ncbi:MAG: helix-turn-helix domain-containing protein [Proteobacteria bacterium]|nr:helix-turn-helix domain-containing protein [Pseudomonadota bacterium]
MIAVAVAGSLLAGGWVWSIRAMAPQFSRINPLAGLPRMLSLRQFGDAGKSCLLATVLLVIGAICLRSRLGTFSAMLGVPLPAAFGAVGQELVAGASLIVLALGLFAAVDVPLPYTARSRHGRLMRLLLDEVEQMPTLPLSLPHPADPRLQAICTALARSPDDASTASDWARRLGVHTKTLHRLFLRETGMSFGQWRQQARLLAALEQLAGGARVIDVALALGYSSPTAFATMFRRQFGVAPSRFFR